MPISPLRERTNSKPLEEKDIPLIRHQFRKVYGWISPQDWDDIPIDELLSDLPFVQEEIRKQEEFRLCSLKFYGVKNPK